MPTLIGPIPRHHHAHLNEAFILAKWFEKQEIAPPAIMIDVGAHHGGSLFPFLNMGWEIFAFEPDSTNRARLIEKLLRHKNGQRVQVDSRCVGEQVQNNVPFFTSDESSGISGLIDFHQSHRPTQTTDVVTLEEFCNERRLAHTTFLKIDTEGNDLPVLKGYPWHQSKPDVILCEYEDAKSKLLGYSWEDLATYLLGLEYQVYISEWYPVKRYGVKHDFKALRTFPSSDVDLKGWGNLIAIHPKFGETFELNKIFDSLVTLEK